MSSRLLMCTWIAGIALFGAGCSPMDKINDEAMEQSDANAIKQEGDLMLDLSSKKQLGLTTQDGSITVKEDANAKQATVKYIKVLADDDRNQDEIEQLLAQIKIEQGTSGDAVTLNVDTNEFSKNYGTNRPDEFHVDLEVTVPAGVNLDLNTNVGRISTEGVQAEITADSDVGGILINGFKGSVIAKSTTGEVTIKGGQEIKTIDAAATTGDVTVSVSDKLNLDVRASSTLGKVESDLLQNHGDSEKELKGKIGSGQDGKITLSTDTGQIRLLKE